MAIKKGNRSALHHVEVDSYSCTYIVHQYSDSLGLAKSNEKVTGQYYFHHYVGVTDLAL